MHFQTFKELSSSNESFWSNIVAPYLAESIFNSSKVKYEDTHKVPEHITEIENTLTTILYEQIENNSNPTEIKRVYLWFGTREQAKSCNASGIDKYNGKYVVIQTTLPDHDIEFYDRYEIIQDSDPLVGGIYCEQRINKVLTSSPRGSTIKELTDNVRVDVIQDAVEKVVENLITKTENKQIRLIAIYETKRTMRRGDSTIFENVNILLGNEKQINDLGEQDEGSFSDEDDDDFLESEESEDDSDHDHAEATDLLMRRLIGSSTSDESEGSDESDESDESHESDESNESHESDESDEEFTYDERVDSVVFIHNKLVPLLDDIELNKENIIPLLKELRSIGTIEMSKEEDLSEESMPDLEDVFSKLNFTVILNKNDQQVKSDTKESDKVEEVFEEVD